MSSGTPQWLGQYKNGVIQGTITVRNKYRQGGSTTVVYTGKPQDVTNQYLYMYSLGYEVELTTGQDTGVWTVRATLNRDVINSPNVPPAPSVRWTLHETSTQQHLLECTDRPVVALLTTPGKEAIESQIKSPLNQSIANYKGANQAAVVSVYNLMRLGAESREQYFPVLKRSATVPADYNIGWALTNNGKVLTNSTLLSSYVPSIAVQSIMPQSSAPVTDANGVTTFGGWLEKGIDVDEIGDNKVTVSQEWQFGTRWAAILYDQI